MGEDDDLITQLISHNACWRTAPATPRLLVRIQHEMKEEDNNIILLNSNREHVPVDRKQEYSLSNKSFT